MHGSSNILNSLNNDCFGIPKNTAMGRKFTGEGRPHEGLLAESVVVSNESLEIVNKFCYLGDMISVGGGFKKSIVPRIRYGWKKFRELFLCTYFQQPV